MNRAVYLSNLYDPILIPVLTVQNILLKDTLNGTNIPEAYVSSGWSSLANTLLL